MWCDAHCHLHDARLDPWRAKLLGEWPPGRLSMVNGTRVGDWAAVVAGAAEREFLAASCGVHPWYVPESGMGDLGALEELLQKHERLQVGEIGLDLWVAGHDVVRQQEWFRAQWRLAERYGRTVTVHCVRAYEPLRQALQELPELARGFLLHAGAPPVELVPFLVSKGAYFSFSPHFLHARKEAVRRLYAEAVPAERLLVETDAPDMAPPVESGFCLAPGVHDPRSLAWAGGQLAALRGLTVEAMAALTTANFHRLFPTVTPFC